ncbi:DNA polymerase III subunit alpha [Pseudovibrio ascidiaceicola]|uniref:DNA polymerase III subunit alpha n=1 Tax=Pseudovibrio ascidiaceicola TaxID=285279 RepID=UPI003D35D579
MITSPFNLNVHSEHSRTTSILPVEDIVSGVIDHGQEVCFLNDTLSLSGAYSFMRECQQRSVLGIIGCRFLMEIGEETGEISLLAKNKRGFEFLCRLLRDCPDGVLAPSVIEQSDLSDLVLACGDFDGPIYKLLSRGQSEDAQALLIWLRWHFGGQMVVQIERSGPDKPEKDENETEQQYLEILRSCHRGPTRNKNGLPVMLLPSSQVRCANDGEALALQALQFMLLEEAFCPLEAIKGGELDLRTGKELYTFFEEPLMNAFDFDRFKGMFSPYELDLPIEKVVTGTTPEANAKLLLEKCRKALMERGFSSPVYAARLKTELTEIIRQEMAGYILIVSDFVDFARSRDIPVGPGRGSSVGSLVCYLLGITQIDPVEHGLLFERFINSARPVPADIDVDISSNQRAEVINYLHDKYGLEHTAALSVFTRLKQADVILQLAPLIQNEQGEGLKDSDIWLLERSIAKVRHEDDPIAKAIEMVPAVAQLFASRAELQVAREIAEALTGTISRSSPHPCGVIISNQEIIARAPCSLDPVAGHLRLEIDYRDAEKAGFLKFDLLSLGALNVTGYCKQLLGEESSKIVNHEEIEERIWKTLKASSSIGIPQFNTKLARATLKKVQPSSFEEVAMLLALGRPGAISLLDEFAALVKGEKTAAYPEPAHLTQPILEQTHGLILYQEQIVQIAQVVGQLSAQKGDLLRRAITKKGDANFESLKTDFLTGCLNNGLSDEDAHALLAHMERFSEYSFAKSHAYAYAALIGEALLLKDRSPAAFLVSCARFEKARSKHYKKFIETAREQDIEVLAPCVNMSGYFESVEPNKAGKQVIRLGLRAIKGAWAVGNTIEQVRGTKSFASMSDFLKQCSLQPEKDGQMLLDLAQSGALDCLNPNRRQAALGLAPSKAPADWGNRIIRQESVLEFNLGDHVLHAYENALKVAGASRYRSLVEHMKSNDLQRLDQGKFSGIACVIKTILRKDRPLFALNVLVEDGHEQFWVVFATAKDSIQRDELYSKLDAMRRSAEPVLLKANLSMQSKTEYITVWVEDVEYVSQFLLSIPEKYLSIDARCGVVGGFAPANPQEFEDRITAILGATRSKEKKTSIVLRINTGTKIKEVTMNHPEDLAPWQIAAIKSISGVKAASWIINK